MVYNSYLNYEYYICFKLAVLHTRAMTPNMFASFVSCFHRIAVSKKAQYSRLMWLSTAKKSIVTGSEILYYKSKFCLGSEQFWTSTHPFYKVDEPIDSFKSLMTQFVPSLRSCGGSQSAAASTPGSGQERSQDFRNAAWAAYAVRNCMYTISV